MWPGSFEASHIRVALVEAKARAATLAPHEVAAAFEEDLALAPLDAFVPRLVTFFREELPRLVKADWKEAAWHVDYRCKGCEYLGAEWKNRKGEDTRHELHCMPEAERRGHLSQVVGLSPGGASLLRDAAPDTPALAATPASSPLFDRSTSLRAQRTLYPERADVLTTGQPRIIRDSGGDALMPKYPDLRLFVFLDFDVATSVTGAFGIRAGWQEPVQDRSKFHRKVKKWRAKEWVASPSGKGRWKRNKDFEEVFLVTARTPDLERERAQLLAFLRALKGILTWVQKQDDADIKAGRRTDQWKKEHASTYQVYLWDEGQRLHLQRVVQRHLAYILQDTVLRDVAWLFMPPDVVPEAEDVSYKSPFTVVADVVAHTVAVPAAHHYHLLDVAQQFAGRHGLTLHPLYKGAVFRSHPRRALA